MKRYEGLFILNPVNPKEDGIKDALDKISSEISGAGGKVETVQKMDRKNFARVTDKKISAGFYANVIFNGTPSVVAALQNKFSMNEDVYRVLFTASPEVKKAAAK